jgi:hypothetical protein
MTRESNFARNWFTRYLIVLYAGAHGVSNDLEVVLKTLHSLRQIHTSFMYSLATVRKKSIYKTQREMNLDNVLFVSRFPRMRWAV